MKVEGGLRGERKKSKGWEGEVESKRVIEK